MLADGTTGNRSACDGSLLLVIVVDDLDQFGRDRERLGSYVFQVEKGLGAVGPSHIPNLSKLLRGSQTCAAKSLYEKDIVGRGFLDNRDCPLLDLFGRCRFGCSGKA